MPAINPSTVATALSVTTDLVSLYSSAKDLKKPKENEDKENVKKEEKQDIDAGNNQNKKTGK